VETIVVGMGDGRVVRGAAGQLVTYALGSCVALAISDPAAQVAGLLHVMLPDSRIATAGQEDAPCRYADTGAAWMFRRLAESGSQKVRWRVYLAGGASVVDDGGVFNIGKRNLTAIRRLLWQAGVPVHAEETGGSVSRTVGLETETGRFWVREPAGQPRTIGPAAPHHESAARGAL
jgi:chemotaxis protein CheD